MSIEYGVCRLRKYKRGAVRGIETHVERRATISNTNPNIERSHSSKNYDLNGRYDDTFIQQINERFAECGIKKSKLRKDAVMVAELLFTASPTFFDGKTDDEIRQYFTTCYEYACSKFGAENIISAMVHLDEKTPHMHLCFVPITKDNRLNIHSYFPTGKQLVKFQDDVHENVFKGYGLERGEPAKETGRKHIETMDWKKEQVKLTEQQLSILENEKATLERQVEYLRQMKETDKLYQTQQKLNEVSLKLEKLQNFIRQNSTLAKAFIDVMNEKEKEEKDLNDR